MIFVSYLQFFTNFYITLIIIVSFQVNDCGSSITCAILQDPRVANCCKDPMKQNSQRRQFPPLFAACLKAHMRDQTSCGFQNCYGQRKGYVNTDGSLNKQGLLQEYSEQFYKQPEIFERVKQRCIFSNLSRFTASCEADRLQKCLFPFMLMKCQNWYDYGSCQGLRQYIDFCAST
ncbi:uncharacterized protein LOC113226404 [Hyposmocoma kahamanoa]|uniref:uncharacterized protein LOC113226404 n=1 Tax=Hyposmocoma kahamanoa TaxID=1477025 RepID=UPI000E6D9298|nr:uncharacterized protein LOC113226404 [Hyposmocoma kahamanoa]